MTKKRDKAEITAVKNQILEEESENIDNSISIMVNFGGKGEDWSAEFGLKSVKSFTYLFSVIPMTQSAIKKVEAVLYRFVWGGEKKNIFCHEDSQCKFEDGGKKLLN